MEVVGDTSRISLIRHCSTKCSMVTRMYVGLDTRSVIQQVARRTRGWNSLVNNRLDSMYRTSLDNSMPLVSFAGDRPIERLSATLTHIRSRMW